MKRVTGIGGIFFKATDAPSLQAPFMVNYRVEDAHALAKALKEEGCNVLETIDESEYGTFAWVIDPEGNKVELWQPPAGQ
jgi:predicted enzyme related to lactoylglutathione lyase